MNEPATPTLEGPKRDADATAWLKTAAQALARAPAEDGIVFVDADLKPLLVNVRAADILGVARADSFETLFNDVALDAARVVKAAIAAQMESAHDLQSAAGPIRISVRPIADAGAGAPAAQINIRAGAAAFATLRAGEDHLRHVLDAVSVMALVLDDRGALLSANRAVLAAADLQPSDVLGASLPETYWWSWSEEAQERLRAAIDAARAGAAPAAYREKLRVGESRLLTVVMQLSPLRDSNGAVRNIVVSATDVSDLVDMQERQALLAGELTHRVKNILAIVKALVSRAARRAASKEALAEALEGRITAMAGAISQLSRGQWTGSDLKTLLQEQLSHLGADRITLAGPDLNISPKAAMAVALIAFEMGSNAAKHGALSAPDGRVDLRWAVENGRFVLHWRERGGPPVADKRETGFGSTLISTLAQGDLSAELDMNFAPGGLEAELRAPIASLRREEAAPAFTLAETERERLAARLRGARAMIVDDSPLVALDLGGMLEAEGATAIGPYTEVKHARAALQQHPCDLAIIDLDWDEAEALAIAELAAAQGAALIFATGGHAVRARERHENAAILAKPYTELDFIGALRAALLTDEA
ncbi:MAG: PAS domain-containing protein [Alphaproteobacteria bacterium]|nr:PAS domain-containing protein [Alphaproteobacteria bacterium]